MVAPVAHAPAVPAGTTTSSNVGVAACVNRSGSQQVRRSRGYDHTDRRSDKRTDRNHRDPPLSPPPPRPPQTSGRHRTVRTDRAATSGEDRYQQNRNSSNGEPSPRNTAKRQRNTAQASTSTERAKHTKNAVNAAWNISCPARASAETPHPGRAETVATLIN